MKIRNNAVTGAKVNELTLGVVPNAADADKLDGADSALFQRRCTAGAIGAYAEVNVQPLVDAGLNNYVNLAGPRFTCANSTSTIRAKRTEQGDYTVDFGFDYDNLSPLCPKLAVALATWRTALSATGAQEDDPNRPGGDCVFYVSTEPGGPDASFMIVQVG